MRPMVEFDALMANPYPLAIPFALLGLALLGFALREGYARPRHAGVGCLGMGFGLWLAATLVELQQNARCRLSKLWWRRFARVKSRPPAVVCIPKQVGRLAMSVRLAKGSPPWIVRSLGPVVIASLLGHPSDQRHHLRSDQVKVDLKVRVVDGGRPIASTWQIELRDGTDGWQVTDVLWRTLLGQRPPSRMP